MPSKVAFHLFCLIATLTKDLEASVTCTQSDISFVCRGITRGQDFPLSIPPYIRRVTFHGTDYHAHSKNFPKGLFVDTSWRNVTDLVIVDFRYIDCIDKTFLEGLVGLKYLSVSFSYGMHVIEPEVFRSTPNLEALHLEMSWWLTVSVVEDALTGTVSGLKYLSLIGLQMRGNPTILGKSFINALSGKNLTYLDISRTNVIGFETDIYWKVLFNLKFLNISNTKITLFRGFTIGAPTPESKRQNMYSPEWEVFDASGCHTFYAYYNTLKTIQLSEPYPIANYKLQYIFIRNLIMPESWAGGNFILNFHINANTVQIIDVSNNKCVYMNTTLFGSYNFQELQKLDLSSNDMEYISPSLLKQFPSLKILNMAENRLLSMQTTEDFRNLLRWNSELRVLSLRNNYLTATPQTLLSSNTKLQLLDLRQNDLNDFNIDLSNMWNLTYIDLSDNRLRNLPSATILTLEEISRHQMRKTESNENYAADIFSLYFFNKVVLTDKYRYRQSFNTTRELLDIVDPICRSLTINLSGNPLQCDCESIYFLKWIVSTNIRIACMESLVCKYGSDQYPLNRETLENVHFDCKSLPIIVKVTVLSATFVLFCVSAFAFRVLYIRRKRGKSEKMEKLRRQIQRKENGLKFIVFLPFCSLDDDTVEKYIRPSLNDLIKQKLNINIEKDRDLVCCGSDYFIPGRNILQEIYRCIGESLVVVPVITPSFLKSQWCKTECMIAIEEHRNVVVLMQDQTDTSGTDIIIKRLVENFTRATWAIKGGEFMIRPQWNIIIQSIIDKAMETACNRREEDENMADPLIVEEEENVF